MTRGGEYPTPSETRVATTVGETMTGLQASLAEAEAHAERMEPSASTRLLRRTLESHSRTIDAWTARPPTDDQLRLMRERVEQVVHQAKTTSPTVRVRRIA
jgi:hypothetical protein